jgi:hypothetical protein
MFPWAGVQRGALPSLNTSRIVAYLKRMFSISLPRVVITGCFAARVVDMNITSRDMMKMKQLLEGTELFYVKDTLGAHPEGIERFFWELVNLFQDTLLYLDGIKQASLEVSVSGHNLNVSVGHGLHRYQDGNPSRYTAYYCGDLHHLGSPSDWQLN